MGGDCYPAEETAETAAMLGGSGRGESENIEKNHNATPGEEEEEVVVEEEEEGEGRRRM